ncbi:MAG: prepilin-type N-terminal cleavage/methylation domain-containing protein [Candidatus Hydrogenedentes bacterium]|nr:prepilin-type N-terminal cleavage/methylation domain-containing protein [Candidatus Hydrogenedentota bacterium]
MRNDGMTLLEVMVSITVLTMVMAMLFLVSTSLSSASASQDARTYTQDQARNAMQVIAKELRQAQSSSINWAALPGPAITYRIATDIDGNGTAVDSGGFLEVTPVRTLGRDTTDANGDGRTTTQAVVNDGARVRVLTNDLLQTEDTNNNGTLDGGEDSNANRVLDRGIWFQASGTGIQVLIQTQRRPGVRSAFVNTTLRETVIPRN